MSFPTDSLKRVFWLAGLVVIAASQSGCSVFMAARTPGAKDLSVLTPGVPRTVVVEELGKPISTSPEPYGSRDVFAFKQGYPAPLKVARVTFHALADVITWGLWEVVGTPMEAAFQGEQVRAEVAYSPDGIVRRVEYFSGAHLAHGGPVLAKWMRSRKTEQTSIVGDFPKSTMSPPGDSPIMQASGTSRMDADPPDEQIE